MLQERQMAGITFRLRFVDRGRRTAIDFEVKLEYNLIRLWTNVILAQYVVG
jgi:hypothetical protein